MKWWKVILLLPLILMIKCRKPNPIQPTNITHQWETLMDSASFIILEYNYTNVTNNQSWNLLDLSEVDSLYIEVSNDKIELTRVEIVNEDSHYGWEHWDVITFFIISINIRNLLVISKLYMTFFRILSSNP